MKTFSLVKAHGTNKGGLANPEKSQSELQNADLSRPSDKFRQANLNETSRLLGLRVSKKNEPAYVCSSALKKKDEDDFVRYTPTSNSTSGIQRIVQISSVVEDPLDPPRHKHKKIAPVQDEQPPQIKRSPPRKLTAKDQQDWKVPACISNWKNANGYTIPLHQRLQADGRNLQDTQINSRFAAFADAMYATERQARKETDERNQIQHAIKMSQQLKREQKIKQEADLIRREKDKMTQSTFSKLADDLNVGAFESNVDSSASELGSKRNRREMEELEEAKKERDEIRRMMKKENERTRRREQAGKNKTKSERDGDRDISEKIALGQAQPNSREAMFDQRLFNQTSGIDTGFGDDEDYNLYDKPLFADRSAASIYKNVNRETGMGGLADQLSDIDEQDESAKPNQEISVKQAVRQQPNRGFDGADKSEKRGPARSKPVEFERKTLEQDASFGNAGGLAEKKALAEQAEEPAKKRARYE